MKIGFIGLGIMGRPMAKNLLKAGYDVTVDSHSPAAAAELEACGAKVADQPTIGSTCDLVLTMLPNAPQVKQVMLGANGVAAHMQPGSTFIDMTSLNPIASKEIAAELAARGIQMLDAPVSGGEPKAIDGTLSFMVGGEEEVFNTFKPVLLAMGSSAVRCGGIGAGNTTKLANQIIVAANIQAVAEALTLAQKAGVDPDLVFQAIKGGLAGSTVMNAKAPMMIEGNDKPGFKVDLHIKDLNNGPGLRPHRGCPGADDRRSAGNFAVAAQQWQGPGGPQRHCPVLRAPDRHQAGPRPVKPQNSVFLAVRASPCRQNFTANSVRSADC